MLGAVTAEQKQFVLTKPREALGQADAAPREGWDPRLSARGNRVSKQMAVLLDRLAWAENFLECRGWTAPGGVGPPGPGPGLRAAGPRREVRGGRGRRPGRGDEPAMNNELVHKIVALFHGGASMRRIARSLGVSRRTVKKALGQVEQARGDGPPERSPRPRRRAAASSTPTNRRSPTCWRDTPTSRSRRVHEELRRLGYTGGYTILSERVRRLASAPGRRARAAVRDRPGGAGANGLLHV